jgi:hypothetical protein
MPIRAGFYDLLFGPHKRFAGEHVTETPTYHFSPTYILTNSGTISEIEGQSGVDRSTYGTVNFPEIAGLNIGHCFPRERLVVDAICPPALQLSRRCLPDHHGATALRGDLHAFR